MMVEQLFTRDGTPKKANWMLRDKPAFKGPKTCWRCGGLGGSDKWGPAGSNTGWTCWRCDGTGIDPSPLIEKLYDAATLDKLNARKAKADAARAEKREAARLAEIARQDAERAQVIADNAELISEIDAELAHGSIDILVSVREQIVDRAREPSDRQIEVVRNIVSRNTAERARRAAARHVGKLGERREFTLTLLFTSTEQTDSFPTLYRHWSIFTDENGCKVVSKSAPWSLGLKRDAEGDYPKGQTIRVKATVKEHRHDKRGEPTTRIDRPKEIV